MCHSIQLKVGVYDFSQDTLSNKLLIEQQCETMATMVNKELFGTYDVYLFDAYFKVKDIQFLNNWYGDSIQNDLNL